MSSGQISRTRARSIRSTISMNSSVSRQGRGYAASHAPNNEEPPFEPCAATASFLLLAQRNEIVILHHDTLAIERRVKLHGEDVLWIAVDNVSEKGSGRLAVSFDTGKTAIVWDLLSGKEVSRFSSYENMRIATFMRNGNIAFGNDQGNVIIFEPSTSEHISARTIFDPITALAPSSDCSSFAIGYMNGSVLIATLQPSFTILHTLHTNRAPSRISDLAWHGSSSKSKTDMLAAQSADADLRVWSVPKGPQTEPPNVIRVLQRSEDQITGPCWCAWSKNGRILQYAEGETRSWDVRTKRVTFEVIPTIEGVAGIANYGSSATLFVLGLDHMVHQYDVDPSKTPMEVASIQHVPKNLLPNPPKTLEGRGLHMGGSSISLGFTDTESSADEGVAPSPLHKLVTGDHDFESEARDVVMPLSPSSRASSVSSRSSGHRSSRSRKYLYDRPDSSRAPSSVADDGTEFSYGAATNVGRDTMSIRTGSSTASISQSRHGRRPSNLRKEMLRPPTESNDTASMELFPYTAARLKQVAMRTPHYGNVARTPDLLQREMLSVIFGWNDEIQALIREEMAHHRPGSAAGILLAKWLGDIGADNMAAMVGSESMTSSDWMMLALSSLGSDSKKQVGEAFVQRLLEKGDIHPAVAILIGLGENNDAIEVYVSQKLWMEAVILTCLTCPSDWQRICYLIRKWGEAEVLQGNAELAVRCFSCTAIETSEPWFSPRAQDAVYAAQQEKLTGSGPYSAGAIASPLSPESRASGRMTAKNAALKLITNFGDQGTVISEDGAVTTKPGVVTAIGVTPIAQSAMPIDGKDPWRRNREPSTARTATPGGFTKKKRLPSRSDIERLRRDTNEIATPMTASREREREAGSRATSRSGRLSQLSNSSAEPTTALKPKIYSAKHLGTGEDPDYLPSPAQGVFNRLRGEAHNTPRDKKPDGLSVKIMSTGHSGPKTNASDATMDSAYTPGPLTDASMRSARGRAGGDIVSSVGEARLAARRERAESRRRADSRKRTESRSGRAASRPRGTSIKAGKRSPSSPVPMSPEEIAQASQLRRSDAGATDEESFYKLTSPTESRKSFGSQRLDRGSGPKATDKAALISSLAPLTVPDSRGRSANRDISAAPRSPSLPLLLSSKRYGDDDDVKSDGRTFRMRARSSSRQPGEDLQSRRIAKQQKPELSPNNTDLTAQDDFRAIGLVDERGTNWETASFASEGRARRRTKKQLAAEELEARRRSLARRPSAPAIPLPSDTPSSFRPSFSPFSNGEFGHTPIVPPARSQTADPEAMSRHGTYPSKITGTSTNSAPIGLPATPRAMRHPKYMNAEPGEREGTAPPVPVIPGKFNETSPNNGISPFAMLAQQSDDPPPLTESMIEENQDAIGPLLPATVFGQKPAALPRSASAPPEKQQQHDSFLLPATQYKGGAATGSTPTHARRMSGGRNVVRVPPPDSRDDSGPVSIDAAFHNDDQIIVVGDQDNDHIPVPPPIILPQLQHLAGPPADPIASGVISIAIDDNEPVIDVQSLPRSATADPYVSRRAPSNDSFGSRFRGIGDRIRSSSKTRKQFSPSDYKPLPYETQLGHTRHESLHRAKSPYEEAMAAQSQHQIPIPPPPPVGMGLNETSIPPSSLPTRSASSTGYRNPREIRANMPPETLQQGVYPGPGDGGYL